MKRFLSLLAFCAICCTSAFAQEVSVIGRFDYPVYPYLYTLVEGELGEQFSYSISNHWVSDDTRALYQNTWRADDYNWCDWAYVSYNPGNWSFTLGKDVIALGSYEIDQNDWDSYWEVNSSFWNNAQVYQWGGKAAYTLPSETSTFALQLSSSPFNYKPFDNGLLSYSFQWSGDFGLYRSLWSVNALQYGRGKGESIRLLACGNQFDATDWLTLGLDYIMGDYDAATSHTFTGSADFFISDHFELLLKGGYEASGRPKGSDDIEDWYGMFGIPYARTYAGAVIQYYPLADSQDLRIHALACYDSFNGPQFSGGITYNFNLTNLFTR